MTKAAHIVARTVSVLIIEDDPDTADSLARFLRFGCGYIVATAPDGLNGVRIAAEIHPDVVVCDIGLPKKNGLLVAEELAASLPCRPLLIAVTGFGDQVSQGLAEAVGFDHFLLKPADPFRIKALIDGEAESLREESGRITGVAVREARAAVEPDGPGRWPDTWPGTNPAGP